MRWIAILLLIISGNGPVDISRVNGMKKTAEKAFESGDYRNAINNYRYLVDSLEVKEDEIFLNLAHAYYQSNDTSNAKTYYAQASMSGDRELKSIAYQQLGVMHKSPQTLNESLQYLKASLKSNPSNEQARYDYEVVKKLLENQKNQQNQQQDQQQKDQEKQDDEQNQDEQKQNKNEEGEEKEQENQNQQEQQKDDKEQEGEQQEESQDQESQESEEQQDQEMSTKDKLEEMNISEEKARMILEAMKNGEIQYLQQQKRKASQRPDSGKPDW